MSSGQKEKLAKALKNNLAITTGLNGNESDGSHEMMLTKTQIGKIKKALGNKTGVDVKISKIQTRKSVKHEAVYGYPCYQWRPNCGLLLQKLYKLWRQEHY